MTSICLLDTSGLGIDTSAICRAAWIDTSASTVSGTGTFRPDGTYELDETFSPSIRIVVPTSCLAAGETCDALAARLPIRQTTPPVACALDGNACGCPLPAPAVTFQESGTASVSGTIVSTTPNDNAPPADIPYCVRGDEIHILGVGMAPTGSSMPVIQSDTIARRL
jgi:hypothetical protein